MPDLCTLEDLKGFLGQTSTDADPLLKAQITSCSGLIMSYLNRSSIAQKSFTEVYDGFGHRARILLRNWPVISIASVSMNGNALTAVQSPSLNASPGTGYVLSDVWDGVPPGNMQEVFFLNTVWPCGPQSISVTYSAGYTVQNEAQTIPATPDSNSNYRVNVAAPFGPWAADGGVSFAGGAALTLVTGTPTTGQYAINGSGGYNFAAADQGKAVTISYSFTPFAIRQACIEMAAERFKYRGRIGERTQTQQGIRTASFSDGSMTPYIKSLLASYMRVVPL